MKYTDPEMSVERRRAGIIRARILRDPCAHCIHRVDGWGKSACMACRTYPACTEQATGPSFELDRETLKSIQQPEEAA